MSVGAAQSVGAASVRPLHPQHGPQRPAESIPVRRPSSIRRTSTIDNLRTDGILGPLRLRGRARDLLTDASGAARPLQVMELAAEVDFTGARTLTRITASPDDPRLADLVGARVSSGFRALVEERLPDQVAAMSPLHLLLDDLPVATLVGGYALSAATRRDPHVRDLLSSNQHSVPVDLCAGWRSGATIMRAIEETGQPPIVTGPPAPRLEVSDDPDGWHERPPLPPHSVRRARLLDVHAGELIDVQSVFRDSHVDEEGLETVVHEYVVHATVDPATLTFVDCVADVRVLPWVECPAAAASAGRLVGMPLANLRQVIRNEFTGISTCTHLNDQLRSLADVPALLRQLP